jgi:hypothetical protein
VAYSAGKRSTGLAISSGIETQVDGSKLIREDLAVNGNITANKFVVNEKIVVKQSGSTGFGDTNDDTHEFVGGSLTLAGAGGTITLNAATNAITATSVGGTLTTAAQPNITSLGSLTGLKMDASSYLNWGSTAGASGYGIRDNSGNLEFKNSSGTWTALGTGGGTSYSAAIGNGSDVNFTVTHNLGSRDLAVTIRETSSPYGMVLAPVEFTTTSALAISFPTAPASNEYTVNVVKV